MKVRLPLGLLKLMSQWETDSSWGDIRIVYKAGKVIKWFNNKGQEVPVTEYGVEIMFFDDVAIEKPKMRRKRIEQAVKDKFCAKN